MGRLSELFRELKESGQGLDSVANSVKDVSNAFGELRNNISNIKMDDSISEELSKIKSTINAINKDGINIKNDSTEALNDIINQLETIYTHIKTVNEYEMAIKVCPTPINVDKIKDEIEQQIRDKVGQIDFNLELSSQAIDTTKLENQMDSFVRKIVEYIESSFNNIQNEINSSMQSMNSQLSQMTGTIGSVQSQSESNVINALSQIINQGTFGSMQPYQEDNSWQISMNNFATQMENATRSLSELINSINDKKGSSDSSSYNNSALHAKLDSLISEIKEAQNLNVEQDRDAIIAETIKNTLQPIMESEKTNSILVSQLQKALENLGNNESGSDIGGSVIQVLESWNNNTNEVARKQEQTNELMKTLVSSLNQNKSDAINVAQLFEIVKSYKDNNLLESSDVRLLNRGGFDKLEGIVESLSKIGQYKDESGKDININDLFKNLRDGTNLDETIVQLNDATLYSAEAFKDFAREISTLIAHLTRNQDKIKDNSIKDLIKSVEQLNGSTDRTGRAATVVATMADFSNIDDDSAKQATDAAKKAGEYLKGTNENFGEILETSKSLKDSWKDISGILKKVTGYLDSWARTLGVNESTHSIQGIIAKEMSYYNDRHTYRVNSAQAAYSVGDYFSYDDAYNRTYNQGYKYHHLSNGLIGFEEYNNRWNNMTTRVMGHYGQDDVGSAQDMNFMTQNLFAFEKLHNVDTTELLTTLYKDLNMNAAQAVFAIQNIGTVATSANIPLAQMMNSVNNIAKGLKNIGLNASPTNIARLIAEDVQNGNSYENAVSELTSELQNRFTWGDTHTGESIFAQMLSGSSASFGDMYATAKLGLGDSSAEMATMANLYGNLLGGPSSAMAQGYMVDVLKSQGYTLKQAREGAKIYAGIANDDRMRDLIAEHGSGQQGLSNWLARSDSAKSMEELQADANSLLGEIVTNTSKYEQRIEEIGNLRSAAQTKDTEFQEQYFLNSEKTGQAGDQYIDTLTSVSMAMATASGTLIDKLNEIINIIGLNGILGKVTDFIKGFSSKFGIKIPGSTPDNGRLLNGYTPDTTSTPRGLSENYLKNGVIDTGADYMDYYSKTIASSKTTVSGDAGTSEYNIDPTASSGIYGVDEYGAYMYLPSNYGMGTGGMEMGTMTVTGYSAGNGGYSYTTGQIYDAYREERNNNNPYISGFSAAMIGRLPGVKHFKKWSGKKLSNGLGNMTKDAIYNKKFNSLYKTTYDDLYKQLYDAESLKIIDNINASSSSLDDMIKFYGGDKEILKLMPEEYMDDLYKQFANFRADNSVENLNSAVKKGRKSKAVYHATSNELKTGGKKMTSDMLDYYGGTKGILKNMPESEFNALTSNYADDILKNSDDFAGMVGDLDELAKTTVKNSDELAKTMKGFGTTAAVGAAKGVGKLAGAVGLDAILSLGIEGGLEWYQYDQKVKNGTAVYGDGHLAVANTLGNVDTAIGSGIGGAGGAALGAAIGSIFSGLGTLIGGIIGGAIGSWAGGKAGGAIGDSMGSHEDWQNWYLKTFAGTDLETMELSRQIKQHGSDNIIGNAYANMGINEQLADRMGDIVSSNTKLFQALNSDEQAALALKLAMDQSGEYLDENNKATDKLKNEMNQLLNKNWVNDVRIAMTNNATPEQIAAINGNKNIINETINMTSKYDDIDTTKYGFGSMEEYEQSGMTDPLLEKEKENADKEYSKEKQHIKKLLDDFGNYLKQMSKKEVTNLFGMDVLGLSDSQIIDMTNYATMSDEYLSYNFGNTSGNIGGNEKLFYNVLKNIQNDYKSGKTKLDQYSGYQKQAFQFLKLNNALDAGNEELKYLVDNDNFDSSSKNRYQEFLEQFNNEYLNAMESANTLLVDKLMGAEGVTKDSTLKDLVTRLPGIIKDNTSFQITIDVDGNIAQNRTAEGGITGANMTETQYNNLKEYANDENVINYLDLMSNSTNLISTQGQEQIENLEKELGIYTGVMETLSNGKKYDTGYRGQLNKYLDTKSGVYMPWLEAEKKKLEQMKMIEENYLYDWQYTKDENNDGYIYDDVAKKYNLNEQLVKDYDNNGHGPTGEWETTSWNFDERIKVINNHEKKYQNLLNEAKKFGVSDFDDISGMLSYYESSRNLISGYERTHDVVSQSTPVTEEDIGMGDAGVGGAGVDVTTNVPSSSGGSVTPQALPTNNLANTMVNTSTLMSAILDAEANPGDMTKAYANGRLLYTKGANGIANYKSYGGTANRNSSLGIASYGAVIDNVAQYGASDMNMSDFQYSMQALRLATDQEEYNSKGSYDYWGYNNSIGQEASAYTYDAVGGYNNTGYNVENKDKGTVQINVFAEDANLNRKLQMAVTAVLEDSGYKTKIDSSYDMASAAIENTQVLANNING